MKALTRPARPLSSGEQYVLQHGQHRAVATEVGATLREYSVAGRAVLDGFGPDERSTDGRGQVLAPWPNRLRGGRYQFGGRNCQAALDEPAGDNAIHGLVRWLPWTLVSRERDSVTLSCTLHPQPAYEWHLMLAVTYALDDTGLTVSTRAVNPGSTAAPFGLGFHPYVTVGTARVDDLLLSIPARTYLTDTDSPRSASAVPVVGTELDFSRSRRVGATRLDTAYGDLLRGRDGRAVARLQSGVDSRALAVWVDERYPYLMVYSADDVHCSERRRAGLAIEPMTCPPNALQTGDHVVVLAPGDTWAGAWGMQPDAPAA